MTDLSIGLVISGIFESNSVVTGMGVSERVEGLNAGLAVTGLFAGTSVKGFGVGQVISGVFVSNSVVTGMGIGGLVRDLKTLGLLLLGSSSVHWPGQGSTLGLLFLGSLSAIQWHGCRSV